MTSTENLINRVSENIEAAVGVMAIRTQEPLQVVKKLTEFGFHEPDCPETVVFTWYPHRGFTYSCNTDGLSNDSSVALVEENTMAIEEALSRITDVRRFQLPVFRKWQSHLSVISERNISLINCLNIVVFPHFYYQNVSAEITNPFALGLLLDLVENLTVFKSRLILLLPKNVDLPGILQDSIPIIDDEAPSLDELREMFYEVFDPLKSFNDFLTFSLTPEQETTLFNFCQGMTSTEFKNAMAKLLRTYGVKEGTFEDYIQYIFALKTESIKRSSVLELMHPVRMEEVGGLGKLKEWAKCRKVAFSSEAREFGVDRPKGVLLLGPPGNAKSLTAKALASFLCMPLIKFDISRVFDSLVGNSERKMREALTVLEECDNCVVLIDEVDKSLPSAEGNGDSGVGRRILGQLLSWQQECTKNVFCVYTANNISMLPPEFLRRGRMDAIFFVDIPRAKEREEIIRIHLKKRKQKDTIPLTESVKASENYVGAEIEDAVKEAVLEAFSAGGKTKVTDELIAKQFKNIEPLMRAFGERLNSIRRWAEENAISASSEEEDKTQTSAPKNLQVTIRRKTK